MELELNGKSIIYVLFICVLIVISIIDIKTRKIPNRLCILICVLKLAEFLRGEISVIDGLKGAASIGGVILVIALVSKDGIGGGDIKLMLAGGFFLESERMLATVIIGMGLAGIAGLIMMIAKVKDRRDTLALGPFLSIGMAISLVYGEQIWNIL